MNGNGRHPNKAVCIKRIMPLNVFPGWSPASYKAFQPMVSGEAGTRASPDFAVPVDEDCLESGFSGENG